MESKAYFDEVAPQWDQMRSAFFSEKVRDTAYVAAGILKGKKAADIGAGTGFVSEGLIAKGLKVIAVDQSEVMLAELQRKFPDLDCRLGDAERLPVADQAVDYVFANMYLHHVEKPLAAIREMTRILKKNGRLVFTDLDTHNFSFLKHEHHDRWMGFARKDISGWMEDCGLQQVYIDGIGQNCCSTSCGGTNNAEVSIFVACGTKP